MAMATRVLEMRCPDSRIRAQSQGGAPVRADCHFSGQLVEDRAGGGLTKGSGPELQQLSSAARAQHAAGRGAQARGAEATNEEEDQGIHGGQLFRRLSPAHQRLHPSLAITGRASRSVTVVTRRWARGKISDR